MPSRDGVTPSLGAGLDDAGISVTGDVPVVKEPAQAGRITLPEAPKPADTETGMSISGDKPSSVIELADRMTEAAETTAVTHGADGPVTVRPKPEKRKNARERAKAKFAKDGTTPDTTVKAKSRAAAKAGTRKSGKIKSAARNAA